MLALKNVLAENDSIQTLIFDEVDTGVSAGQPPRWQKDEPPLPDLPGSVRHPLGQIAAMADSHYSVHKEERGGRTYTQVEDLDRQGRKEELARLTGGSHLSQTILEGAEELLQEAEGYKAEMTAR